MKIRNGFVSNSSSSSFIIRKCVISEHQMDLIKSHIDSAIKFTTEDHLAVNFGYAEYEDAWNIEEKEKSIRVSTHMDNFNMHEFLKYIGIPDNEIIYNEY